MINSSPQNPQSYDSFVHFFTTQIANPNPNPNISPFTPFLSTLDPHPSGIDPYVNSASNPLGLDNPVDKIPVFHGPNRVSRNWEVNPFGSVVASPRSDIVNERSKINQAPKSGDQISEPDAMKGRGPVWCNLCDLDRISWYAYHTQLLVENYKRKLHEKCTSNFIESQQTGQDGVNGTGGSIAPDAKNLNQKGPKLVESGTSLESMRISALCDITCASEVAFAGHLTGKKRMEKAGATVVWCEVCKIKCHNTKMLQIHKLGKRHQRNLIKQKNPEGNEIALSQAQPIRGEQSNSDRPDLQSGAVTVAAIAENTGEKDQETKNLQTGWYAVCETNCDVTNLENHELGRKHQKNLVKQKNPEGNDMAPTETQPMSEEPSSSSNPNPQTGSGTDATITDDTGEKDQQVKKNLQTGCSGEPSSSSSPIPQAGAGTVATIADNTGEKDRQEKKNPQTGWSGEPNSSSSPNLQAGVGTVATIAENTGEKDQQETKNQQIGLSGEPSSSSSPNPLAGAATVANIAENTDKKDLQETKNPQTGWSGEPNSSNSPNPQAGAGSVATFAENKSEKDQHESKNLQTGWFEVCKINCDIKNLENHKLGRKHPKNIVKPKNPEGEAIAPTQSQTMSGEPNNSSILNQKKWKRKHAPGSSTLDDLETKRRRVLGYGIQPGAIRICHICNVICSHEKMFNDHLAGRKHTSKSRVLKVAAAGKVPTEPLVNAATAGDGCIIVQPRQE